MAGWRDYWEAVPADERFPFPQQAGEYVDDLRREIGLDPSASVLDFGCGFGTVAALVAPQVKTLSLWDASPAMRARAADRLRAQGNVRVAELGTEGTTEGPFDLILVNSVVQYMTDAELGAWIGRWAGLLSPGGRVVVSDLIRPGTGLTADLADMLRLSARHRARVAAAGRALRELRSYSQVRRAHPLLAVDPADLCRRAEAVGLGADILPENLTHLRSRATVVMG
ncbi:MAG: class I SAM-dependent methyltransferase [Acidimicrobiales bacterium]